uniref:transglutaminase domain-containing protein n=1 Tax=uncultured Draconibacterium sp. TaxID=1573823 RepID=UPI003216D4A0
MKKSMTRILIISLFGVAFVIFILQYKPDRKKNVTPRDLEYVLHLSGSNREELLDVLNYYRLRSEEKYFAAKYLIGNMLEHYGIQQAVQDSMGNFIDFNFSDFHTGEYKRLQATLDSLGCHIVQIDKDYDLHHITADFLIENIDLAFEVWDYPWCKHLSFEQFCEYILPYRCQSEPISKYRKYFKDKYNWLADSVKNSEDVVEVAALLQKQLQKEIAYSTDIVGLYEGFLSPEMMEEVRVGACESIANYTVLAMRSCGIPITYDHILYWGRTNSGHAYNSIISKDGEYIFSLPDAPPRLHVQKPGCTRVWRNTWKFQKDGIWLYASRNEVPSEFLSRHYKDVTSKYSSTSRLNFKNKNLKKDELVYLCVFNTGDWRTIGWSNNVKNEKVQFENVSENLLYAVMSYDDQEFKMIGDPFIFYKEDSLLILKPELTKRTDISMTIPKSGCRPNILGADTTLNFCFWDNGWVKQQVLVRSTIETKTKSDGSEVQIDSYSIKVPDIPSNALYWLGGVNRLYVVENGVATRY